MKSLLVVFMVVFAALPILVSADTVNVSATTNITLGSATYQINGKVDTVTTDGSTLNVTLPADATYNVDIISSDKYTFTYTETTGWNASFTCDTDQSKLSFSAPTVSKTVTVTPVATVCTAASTATGSGSGSSSSGGGGGGGSYLPAPVPPPVVLPTVPPAMPLASLVESVPTSISAVFTKSFSMGSNGSDIRRLQQLLNSDPDTKITASGAGSPGNETDRFGSLTKAALIKFQIKYNIVKSLKDIGAGTLGPKTRAKLKEIFSGKATVAPSSATQSSSDQVKSLQDKLNSLFQQLQNLKH